MSAPAFNAMDWLHRWTGSGNTAYATVLPGRSITLNFDGDNVGELLGELRDAKGDAALYAALIDLRLIHDHREARHA